jgi:hypothetical protein
LCARFVPVAAPWLLARTDPTIRGLSKTAHPGLRAGARAPEPPHHACPPLSRAHSTDGLDLPCEQRKGARVPYARSASITDTTGVNNIITNNNFSGPNTVLRVATTYYLAAAGEAGRLQIAAGTPVVDICRVALDAGWHPCRSQRDDHRLERLRLQVRIRRLTAPR